MKFTKIKIEDYKIKEEEKISPTYPYLTDATPEYNPPEVKISREEVRSSVRKLSIRNYFER